MDGYKFKVVLLPTTILSVTCTQSEPNEDPFNVCHSELDWPYGPYKQIGIREIEFHSSELRDFSQVAYDINQECELDPVYVSDVCLGAADEVDAAVELDGDETTQAVKLR